MEGGDSIVDSIFDEDKFEDVEDEEMLDVEEGELVEQNVTNVGQSSGGDTNLTSQESQSKIRRRKNKKKQKRKRGSNSGPNVTDINSLSCHAFEGVQYEMSIHSSAHHSGRIMVYINPETGFLEEQHPVEQRKPFMWAKYFNITLLKSMDEDLAEAAEDGDHPSKRWLWPLTGEVYWQGVYEREREERYRLKMDKKRKTKEKLLERMKNGYKQKSLGG